MRGVLLDVPAAVAAPDPRLVAQGIGDRCELVGEDFFAAVPAGADAYVLKSIIHDWDDDRALAILETCREAMPLERI